MAIKGKDLVHETELETGEKPIAMENLSSDPSTGQDGRIFINTTSHTPKVEVNSTIRTFILEDSGGGLTMTSGPVSLTEDSSTVLTLNNSTGTNDACNWLHHTRGLAI